MTRFENDQEIAVALKASNKDALKTFYLKYYQSIVQFLYHRLYRLDLAEDLSQDVFFKLWETRHKIDPGKSLKSYVYQIANHLFIDYKRHIKVERLYSESQAHPAQRRPDIEIDMSIQMAIDKLPENLKIVFILSRAEGFSHKEIALTLNTSVKTVEHRIYRALSILKKELDE